MTIIGAVHRPGRSVLVAADRLVGGFSEHVFREKIARHPRLPIAVATMGIASLVYSGRRAWVTDLLDLALARIRSVAEADSMAVAKMLFDAIGPIFAAEVRLSGAKPDEATGRLWLFVGSIGPSGSGLCALDVRTGECNSAPTTILMRPPPSIDEADFRSLPEVGALQGVVADAAASDRQVGGALARLLGSSIEHVLRTKGSVVDMGGHVDVVLVDKRGARRLKVANP